MSQLLQNARKRYGVLHIGYLFLMGIIGWVLLAYNLYKSADALLNINDEVQLQVLVCTIITAFACRTLTFKVYDHAKISIDTAYYTAVVFVLNPLVVSLVAGVALSLETIARFVGSKIKGRVDSGPLLYRIAQVIFNGGVPIIALLTASPFFSINGVTADYESILAITLTGYTCACLLIHYLIAALASVAQGRKILDVFFRFYVGVIGYEITMIPLSVGLLLGYIHQGFWYFLLLTAAYLVCNFLCRKLADQYQIIHLRAKEMETLNEAGQHISAKLQMDDLMQIVAEYSQKLVTRTPSRFVFGLINDKNRTVVDYTLFSEENGHMVKQRQLAYGQGLSGRVMTTMKPIMLNNAPVQALEYQVAQQYIDPRFHSWIGVPLLDFDEAVGLLTLQTEQRDAYNENTLQAFLTIARQTSIAVQNAKLYKLATKDGLSKLYVRRYFEQRLVEEWARTNRYKTELALLMLDLDDFKQLNDLYGHQAGDKVIRRVADIVISSLRADDIPARYGGEEFAFILPNTGLAASKLVADRIVKAISEASIAYDNVILHVTASIGVAAMPENKAENSDELIAMADRALYEAKATGKNCSQVYRDELTLHLNAENEVDVKEEV